MVQAIECWCLKQNQGQTEVAHDEVRVHLACLPVRDHEYGVAFGVQWTSEFIWMEGMFRKERATSWKSEPLFLLVIRCQAASMSPGYLIYKMMGCRRQGILALAAHQIHWWLKEYRQLHPVTRYSDLIGLGAGWDAHTRKSLVKPWWRGQQLMFRGFLATWAVYCSWSWSSWGFSFIQTISFSPRRNTEGLTSNPTSYLHLFLSEQRHAWVEKASPYAKAHEWEGGHKAGGSEHPFCPKN